ncbi:MAG: hypothetical protein HN712_13035 [Gemmatimonadetes bacterium]|nr:hypothetical protein [Gemmatimonadota bacterium]MBT7861239.1 hypothetical protein [Gemmatimonadota bacterium]
MSRRQAAGLLGNTGYTYEILVDTRRGETIASDPQTIAFHALIDSWSLANFGSHSVRLYSTAEGILAISSGIDGVELLEFSDDGSITANRIERMRDLRNSLSTAALDLGGDRLLAMDYDTQQGSAVNIATIVRVQPGGTLAAYPLTLRNPFVNGSHLRRSSRAESNSSVRLPTTTSRC